MKLDKEKALTYQPTKANVKGYNKAFYSRSLSNYSRLSNILK